MFAKEAIKQIQPYRVVPQEAWTKSNVLKLDWNESTNPISPHVRQALLNAIDAIHLNWYPNVNNQKLTEMLATYAGTKTSNILYFASSDSAQEYIARTFLNERDNVLILAPTYDNFRVTCQSESYNIFFHYLNEKLLFDSHKFEKDIARLNPKLVYIANPNNPTGTEYSRTEIEHLLKRYPNTLFMLDEAYIEFAMNAESTVPLVEKYNNLIITRTFSKAFGLAGFRIGYVIGNESLIEGIAKIRNSKSITSLSQVVAIAALEDIKYMHNYVNEVKVAKTYFMNELEKLNISFKFGGGNFVLLQPNNPKALIAFLKEHDIYVRDYTHVKELYGYNMRITVGTKEQMKTVINIIKQYPDESLHR
jgi:histidinol-phosphate aminotransferase